MGIKSTVNLTKGQADAKFNACMHELFKRFYDDSIRNDEMEDLLEILNDFLHGGEGYENYLIRGI